MSTVLLVEDSMTDREIMNRYLQQLGFSVVNAKSSEEAHLKLQTEKPSLIILDVILPGQSGFELCREIKSDPDTSQIPVFICSTKDTDVDKLWGSMLGADAYLPKPIQPNDLVRTIKQFVK
jgi:DNA-binding response OmpR family regulator